MLEVYIYTYNGYTYIGVVVQIPRVLKGLYSNINFIL